MLKRIIGADSGAVLFVLSIGLCACSSTAPLAKTAPAEIAFERGNTAFAPGDEIIVTRVVGDRPTIGASGRYHVEGTWKLSSRPSAIVAVFCTNGEVDGGNHASIDRGAGAFSFDVKIVRPGFLHVSFYPAPGGESFGGTYFGTGSNVYRGWYVPGSH